MTGRGDSLEDLVTRELLEPLSAGTDRAPIKVEYVQYPPGKSLAILSLSPAVLQPETRRRLVERVENHCPGALVGAKLLEGHWSVPSPLGADRVRTLALVVPLVSAPALPPRRLVRLVLTGLGIALGAAAVLCWLQFDETNR